MKILHLLYSKKKIAAIQERKDHEKEVQHIKDAKAYMNKWDDMPMTWLQDELFRILDLPRNKTCKDFFIAVLTGNDDDLLARELKKLRDFHKPTIYIHDAKY